MSNGIARPIAPTTETRYGSNDFSLTRGQAIAHVVLGLICCGLILGLLFKIVFIVVSMRLIEQRATPTLIPENTYFRVCNDTLVDLTSELESKKLSNTESIEQAMLLGEVNIGENCFLVNRLANTYVTYEQQTAQNGECLVIKTQSSVDEENCIPQLQNKQDGSRVDRFLLYKSLTSRP